MEATGEYAVVCLPLAQVAWGDIDEDEEEEPVARSIPKSIGARGVESPGDKEDGV